jgi:hypothetical protein
MTALVNVLTEAVGLGQPPRLISINRGSLVTLPTSVKD